MPVSSNLLLFTSHARFIPRSSFSYNPLRAIYQQEDWCGYQEFDQGGETAAWRVESARVIVRERRERIDLTRKACPEPSRRVIPSTFAGLSVNSARNLGEIAQPVPSEAEGAPPRDDTGPGHEDAIGERCGPVGTYLTQGAATSYTSTSATPVAPPTPLTTAV